MEKKLILTLTISLGILVNFTFAQSATFDFENVTAEGTEFIIGNHQRVSM